MNCKQNKERVLIVHNYYQTPGGEDTVVANEKRLLEEHGHEVILYTRHNDELKKMSMIRKLGLPFTTIFNIRTYRDIKRIITRQHIEIVHVHNTLNLISPSVYYAAVKCGVPVIQTMHNFRFLCPGATFYRDGHLCEDCVSKGLRCAVKHGCYRNSRVQTSICVISTWIHRHTGILGKINYIALTEFNKEKLLQLKQVNPKRVFVKPNFTFEISAQTHGGGVRKYFLFIGRIEEIKGIRILVEAFLQMPDKELLIVGEGPLRLEMERNSTKNIKYLGLVSHNDVINLMAGAIAVILPSQIYEGFPMTITEAFSMHTPMIVGNVGNNGALVKEGFNGMKFHYDSVEDLIATVHKFESSNNEVLGEQAYSDYRSQYTSEANYEALKKIYDEVR